ncbi:MAG TPA: DUF5686 and carboxypeptidase regulatory-like domain-containing protein [Mucilaginibacter sp.]
MKLALSLLFTILFGANAYAQLTITGKIKDEQANPVPFATIYVKNTTTGTSANSEGEYTLQLKPGQYEVLYKAVGYKQESRKLEIKTNQVINVNLTTENYQLKDVTIRATGEDPAYGIIRKAIKKRKTYLSEVKAYTCDVYIKGLQKLLGAPKKFMGRDIDKLGREIGLDSNRKGIIYLSESESKYSYQYPNRVHEEMISSKVSGRNQAFSFNRVTDMAVNFYENLQNWQGLSNRPLVSPIADDAMLYYKYQLIGESTENGETIYKIQVTPRRAYDPCFEGIIYILKDSWRIYGLNLYITKKANINFVDTVKVNQQFFPVSNKAWMTSSIKLEFAGSFLGFKFGGYFISIYKNYDLNPVFNKKDFAEVLRMTKQVNKKDAAYWNTERPIPLTEEEKADYIKKDKLAQRRESKEYMDSLDRANNKFKPGNLLLGGIDIRNRYEKEYYHFDGLLNSLLFNTVEGFAINYGATFTKQIDTATNRYLRLGAKVRYGFSDHLLNGSVSATLPLKTFRLNISGGSDVVDLNNLAPVSPFLNSAYSLLNRQNLEKLYQKDFANFSIAGRITGGWQASAGIEWANRKWLPNTSSYSLLSPRGHQYTSNNPLVPAQDVSLFPENQSFKFMFRTTYDFSDKYETYPNGRRYLPSPYPTIGFSYTKGIKSMLGSDVNYDLVSADISKSNIPMGMYGKTSFYLGIGKFINADQLYFPDYKQFGGNEVFFYQAGISRYLLLDYYRFSTYTQYFEGHFEHNFSGFILNKIPFIRKLKLQEIVDVNYLSTPNLKNYTELGFGVQYLNFRLMYGKSYNSGSNINSALRLGVAF